VKRKTIGCGLLLLFLFSVVPVYGSQLTDLQKQQRQTKQTINSYKKEINVKTKQIKTVTQQMAALDQDIQATEADIQHLQSQLSTVQGKVAVASENLKQTKVQLNDRTEIFSKRLVAIYEGGQVDYLDVLTASTSFTDFLVRFELLSNIAKQDMSLLDTIEKEKAKVEDYKSQLEDHQQEIEGIKVDTEDKQASLEVSKEEKAKLQDQLSAEKEQIEQALAEEQQSSNDIAKKIREIQAKLNKNKTKPAQKYTGGQFNWPMPSSSRITSPFGYRVHPVLHVKKLHTGIDISCSSGSTVQAAAKGTVVFAGWFGAYGNTVLIEHGSSITTLYGHLSSISVKEGESVSKGDNIAKSGNTGLSTGPHLHFEVRVKGDPVSPMPYLQ
jgi:murein DD-endopeptidase MepM/ murein hydrolase activator NlpD